MKTARMAGTASILAMLVLLGGIGVVTEATAEGTEQAGEFENVTVAEEKVEGVLGGGNFIGIMNEDKDAMIGILYGTQENPNYVYVISIFTRYLGVADIYGEKGAELASGKPIPVRTLYAQRFDTLYEFQDSNDDGIWDSRRMVQKQGNDTDPGTMEPVFKKVSLNTAWTPSGVKKTVNGNGSAEWEITLTAKNLRYKGVILGLPMDRQDKLEKVELTFHLYAQKRNVTKDDVPVYRVDVSRSDVGWRIDDVKAKGNRTYSGVAVSADVKYDHYIEGWDFVKRDQNPHLMLSTEVLFLNAISPRATEWLRNEYKEKFGEANGTAGYESTNGSESIDQRRARQVPGDPVLSENMEKPRIIRKNMLGFADNWEKVGRLRWVSNVTVDGNDTNMFFQVYMGRAFAGINAKGSMYAGFGIVGGFSYPGGSKIYHDPSISVEAFTLTPGEDNDRPIVRAIIVGMILFVGAAIFVVIGVVAVGGLLAMRRKESIGSGKGDDEDYYETYYIEKKRK
jgi:hypothetical protein